MSNELSPLFLLSQLYLRMILDKMACKLNYLSYLFLVRIFFFFCLCCTLIAEKTDKNMNHQWDMYVWRVISTLLSCSTLPWFRVTASARYTANPTTPANCIKQPVNISILSCVVRFCHFLFTYHICTKNVTKAAKPDKNKEKQMIYVINIELH